MADADTPPTEGNESTTDTPEPTEETGEPTPTTDDKPSESPDELLTKLRHKTQESTKYQKRAQAAEKELEKFREAQLTEQEKAIKVARDEALAEGLKVGNQRLIRAEIIAAAAGKAADPADVYAILTASGSLNGLEVGEDGSIDTDLIGTAIDDLMKAKPHLAAVRSPSFGARSPADTPTSGSDMDAIIRSARHG